MANCNWNLFLFFNETLFYLIYIFFKCLACVWWMDGCWHFHWSIFHLPMRDRNTKRIFIFFSQFYFFLYTTWCLMIVSSFYFRLKLILNKEFVADMPFEFVWKWLRNQTLMISWSESVLKIHLKFRISFFIYRLLSFGSLNSSIAIDPITLVFFFFLLFGQEKWSNCICKS